MTYVLSQSLNSLNHTCFCSSTWLLNFLFTLNAVKIQIEWWNVFLSSFRQKIKTWFCESQSELHAKAFVVLMHCLPNDFCSYRYIPRSVWRRLNNRSLQQVRLSNTLSLATVLWMSLNICHYARICIISSVTSRGDSSTWLHNKSAVDLGCRIEWNATDLTCWHKLMLQTRC